MENLITLQVLAILTVLDFFTVGVIYIYRKEVKTALNKFLRNREIRDLAIQNNNTSSQVASLIEDNLQINERLNIAAGRFEGCIEDSNKNVKDMIKTVVELKTQTSNLARVLSNHDIEIDKLKKGKATTSAMKKLGDKITSTISRTSKRPTPKPKRG